MGFGQCSRACAPRYNVAPLDYETSRDSSHCWGGREIGVLNRSITWSVAVAQDVAHLPHSRPAVLKSVIPLFCVSVFLNKDL
jgi:hypothetical protein